MRVLELGARGEQDAAAAYCGKLLARWGAEVIRVEPPGDQSQDSLPSAGPSAEAVERYLHGGKRRVALDYREPGGREQIAAIASRCDVLLTAALPRDVDAFGLLELGGAGPAVRTSVTPFGLSGPYRDHESTASTLLALGGYTFLSGDPGRAPLTMPGRYPYYQAGTYAYIGTVAAHLAARPGAGPRTVEVSVLECLASLHQFTDVMWTFRGQVRSRHGNRWENLCPTTLLPCKDGWFGVNILPNFWEPFALWLGRPDLVEDERFATNPARMERQDEVEAIIVEAFASRTKAEALRDGQETWRVPIGPMFTLADALDDRHLGERGFWRAFDGGVSAPGNASGSVPLRTAGSPYRFVGEPRPPEPPPTAVETDGAALAGSLPPLPSPPPEHDTAGEPSPAHLPLRGIRIVDMTRIWSGPLAARILGDLGADVVKIEAPTSRGPAIVPASMGGYYPDGVPGERPWNRQGLSNKLNRNKRSVALDLKAEGARDLFLRLVARSDIVIENFSARAMPRLRLGYEQLREANERIIYIAMPAFGIDGPYRDYIGLGPSIEPVTGLNALMGYSDDEPRVTSQALTDAMSGTTAAAAMLTALERRDRTGEGAFIDLSQHEVGVAYLGEHFIERQTSGREPSRMGNAHPRFAPHGVYRCRGEDEWIALAVRSDEEWAAMGALAGESLSGDARFASAAGRLEHRAELDRVVEAWTAGGDKFDLATRLREAGVPAGAVQSAPEMMADAHLNARDFFTVVEETDAGRQRYDGLPLRFDGERSRDGWLPSPGLGEHNGAVLGDLLGLSEAEIAALFERGVIVDRPPG